MIHKSGLDLLPGFSWEKRNEQGLNSSPSLRYIELVSLRRSCSGVVSPQSQLVMQFPLDDIGVGIRTFFSRMQSGD